MNKDNFFPSDDYKIPSNSNYFKFMEGENTFRVLSSAIIGYEYYTNNSNKPVRSRTPFDEMPVDIKNEGQIKHFWAFIVWNYKEKRIQILELTQKSIMQTMQVYIKNPKWGNPREYDFIVSRTGSGLDTEYAVSVNPKSPLEESISVAMGKQNISLEALYEGLDPFQVNK
jgi:hypothetical protein